MSVDKVFCNIPWTEVHINADGTYHTCGAQPNRVRTEEASLCNVHTMGIDEWVNHEYQRKVRLSKLNGIYDEKCNMCYYEEKLGHHSKRVKENLKSKIHPLIFHKTYKTSPDLPYFTHSLSNDGESLMQPNSFHISLGNECNLACRHCTPFASSKLAVEQIKLGTMTGPAKMNWTDNTESWDRIINYLCDVKDLKFVHIIGGEPLLTPRFEELIDRLLAAEKTDIYIGFTTNGTIVNVPLIEKLNAFRHVDIGVSLECTGKLNDYIRRGLDTDTVLKNTELYLKYRKKGHVYVTMRTVPSALSVHRLDDLYRWCIDRELDVMTNILDRPAYMQIRNLPQDVKNRLLAQYSEWAYVPPMGGFADPRDPHRFREHIDNEIRAVVKALQETGDDLLTEELYKNLRLWNWLDDEEIAKYFETTML